MTLPPSNSNSTFAQAVSEAFSYLGEAGFVIAEREPTLVRYARRDVEINVFHGRKSFEIGVEIVVEGQSFSFAELIRISDPALADSYDNPAATDAEGIVCGVFRVALLFRQYGSSTLRGDESVVTALTSQRQASSEAFEFDVLARQIRPQAELAFKSGDYLTAAQLYGRIRSSLSPAEKRKLALAEARSATRH